MNTTELFDFKFVDRVNEQKMLNRFFFEKNSNTLWIKGKSGMGKTTFFRYVFKEWNEYKLCFVDIKSSDDSAKIITNFILELQKQSSIDFVQTVKKNYKKFYNSLYKSVKEITDELFPTISKIVSILIDANYYVMDINDESKNSIEIIKDYISFILKSQKLCICIDNFSRCDISTAQLFFQVFKSFTDENMFRSCIITTTEELQGELLEEIQRNLPYIKIDIEQLDKYIYFYEMLEPIFELENFKYEDFEYLFTKCKGSPKKLSTVISKMLDKNGIIISSSAKAKINKDTLYQILQNENLKFKEEDFAPVQKWVIYSYLCLFESINIEQLKKFALYVATRCFLFSGYSETEFTNEFVRLFNNHVFACTADGMVTMFYDEDYRELMDSFHNSPYIGMFSQYAYEFLKMHPEYPESQALLCKSAKEANLVGWEQMTFHYGKLLTKKKQFYDAQKYFSILLINKLHIIQILYIAINSYETGNYQLAIEQLNSICPEKLKFSKVKYYYYFFLGKSYNNIGLVSKGASMLEKAIKEIAKDSKEYVQTLNILHMYYLEIPGKRSIASQIFVTIRNNYKERFPRIWANTMRGCQNFLKPSDALDVLYEAFSLVDNELEKAYLKTTMGFVNIKQDNIDEAQKLFDEACHIIKPLKVHEFSYAANNQALCYMLNGDYLKAKEILIEALFWNKTEYGKIVIQTHLMMCAVYLKQFHEAEEYHHFLVSYMEQKIPQDPVIIRKVYLNLAIASEHLDFHIQKEAFYNKVSSLVKNTSSEWRYYALLKQKNPLARPSIKSLLTLDFEPWFLVYAHD